MIKKFEIYNESIRDKMTPKSDEDIKQIISNSSVRNIKDLLYRNKTLKDSINPYDISRNIKYEKEDSNKFVSDVYNIVYWDSIFTSLTKDEFVEDKFILNRMAEGFQKEAPGDVAKEIKIYLKRKGHTIK